jgi:hypothetical protein
MNEIAASRLAFAHLRCWATRMILLPRSSDWGAASQVLRAPVHVCATTLAPCMLGTDFFIILVAEAIARERQDRELPMG